MASSSGATHDSIHDETAAHDSIHDEIAIFTSISQFGGALSICGFPLDVQDYAILNTLQNEKFITITRSMLRETSLLEWYDNVLCNKDSNLRLYMKNEKNWKVIERKYHEIPTQPRSLTSGLLLLKSKFETSITALFGLSGLSKHILSCLKAWKGGESSSILVCLLALVGPSGIGKSKYIRELHHQRYCIVMYMCCRKDSTGYPMMDLTFSVLLSQFVAALSHAEILTSIKVFLFRFLIQYCALLLKETGNKWGFPASVPLSDDNQIHLVSLIKDMENMEVTKLEQLAFDFIETLVKTYNRPVVLCLDEARTLLNMEHPVEKTVNVFLIIRRILYTSKLCQLSNFVTIVVDTSSNIANFSPPDSLQSSARGLDREIFCRKLLPPFHRFLEVDSCALLSQNDIMSMTRAALKKFVDSGAYRLCCLYSMGRPLWMSLVSMDENFRQHLHNAVVHHGSLTESDQLELLNAFSSARKIAEQKLTCSSVDPYTAVNLSEIAFRTTLACTSLRTGFQVDQRTHHARELVAGHLAYCNYISSSRDRMEVKYLHEPILDQVAIQLMNAHDEMQLQHLQMAFNHKMISPGPNGECVASLAILMVLDKLRLKIYSETRIEHLKYMGPVPFIDFMEALTGQKVSDNFRKQFDGAQLTMTRFVQAAVTPTYRMLHFAIARSVGFLLPMNSQGADLFVPFIDLLGQVGVAPVSIKNFSKTTSDSSYDEVVTKKLSPGYVFKGLSCSIANGSCVEDLDDEECDVAVVEDIIEMAEDDEENIGEENKAEDDKSVQEILNFIENDIRVEDEKFRQVEETVLKNAELVVDADLDEYDNRVSSAPKRLKSDDSVVDRSSLNDKNALIAGSDTDDQLYQVKLSRHETFQEFKGHFLNHFSGYVGVYLQLGPGNRPKMTRPLQMEQDGTYRCCVMLHDEISFSNLSKSIKTLLKELARTHCIQPVHKYIDETPGEWLKVQERNYPVDMFGGDIRTARIFKTRVSVKARLLTEPGDRW